VKRPLVFTLDDLGRYPMESRIAFLECAGNGGAMFAKQAAQLNIQEIHGLLSCQEWTGIRLAMLLEEAGVDPRAKWLLAEGADAAAMSRSFPIEKALDDAMIALYQNGERVRPSNGYPMRLLLPGFEGNMNVKWLRRIKLTEGPTMTKDETSKYTITEPSGKSLQFVFTQQAKSMITQPSPGLTLHGAGLYEISGLAWSGYGKVAKVEVSADGGKSWGEAALQPPVLSKALTRFRMAWQWNGAPAVLLSRTVDETGYAQPSRAELIALRGDRGENEPKLGYYHYNGITSWGVSDKGEVKNVYV
jgi:sulfane dehydrogenase subunit SoxC